MSGGGHGLDSHRHITNCLRALARVEHPSLDVVLVHGPLFTSSLRIPPGFPHQVTVLSRSSRLPNLLSAADVVLCRGGYGSLHEATAGGAAVLATPAERTWDDQERRIEQFSTAGSCEWWSTQTRPSSPDRSTGPCRRPRPDRAWRAPLLPRTVCASSVRGWRSSP
jgi:UDP-N-acetylglucosamine:LPS N-acetylglucosamine transferase